MLGGGVGANYSRAAFSLIIFSLFHRRRGDKGRNLSGWKLRGLTKRKASFIPSLCNSKTPLDILRPASLTFGKSSSASSKVEEDKSTGGLSIVSRRRPPGGGTRRLESLFLPPSIPAFPAPAAPLFRRLLDPASNPVLFYPLTALRIA